MNQDDVLNNKKDQQSPMPEVSAFQSEAEDVDYKRPSKKGKSSGLEIAVKAIFGLVVLLAVAGVVFSNLPGEPQAVQKNDFSVASPSQGEGNNANQAQAQAQAQAQVEGATAKKAVESLPVADGNQSQVDSSVFDITRTKNKDAGGVNDQASVSVTELTKLNQRLDDISNRLAELEKKSQSAPAWIDFETLKSEVAELSASKASKQRAAPKRGNSVQSVNTNRERPIRREKSVTTSRASMPQVNKKVKKEKYTLMAVVQDQAWLSNERGETISLSVAKPVLPGYGRVILFDGENLKICFDNGSCMQ